LRWPPDAAVALVAEWGQRAWEVPPLAPERQRAPLEVVPLGWEADHRDQATRPVMDQPERATPV
jgi:hypothetical protein